MKKGRLKTIVLLLTAAAALTAAGNVISASLTSDMETGKPIAATQIESNGGYVVKSYNGVVALYSPEYNEIPAAITEIPIESLRAYDRELLENGINVGTYDDVLRLFEDLSN